MKKMTKSNRALASHIDQTAQSETAHPFNEKSDAAAELASGAALLSTDAAALYLGYPPETLRTWRFRGTGPAFLRFPGVAAVKYRRAALDEWIKLFEIVPPRTRAKASARPALQTVR